jgi:hypothetical protein
MKKHYLVVIVTVLWIITSSMPLLASGKEHPQIGTSHATCCAKVHAHTCFDGPGVMCCNLSKCIPDLTPEQKSKIRNLGVACQKKLISLNADLKKLKLDMKTLFVDHADRKKVNAKIDEMAQIKAQMLKERYGYSQDIRNLLTDKQKKHLEECCKKGSGGCCQFKAHDKCRDCKHHDHGKGCQHKKSVTCKTTP